MMPVRYSAINKTTGTGPSSMMAAVMVTAATCNQNEKIEKHVTPTSTLPPQQPSPIIATKLQGKISHYFIHYINYIGQFFFFFL